MSAVKRLLAGKVNEIKRKALGNSNIGLKEICCDLLNQEIPHGDAKALMRVANGTFLCPSTLLRVLDCEENYSPQAQTLERIMRYCNISLTTDYVVIKTPYLNNPKIANAEEEGRYIES